MELSLRPSINWLLAFIPISVLLEIAHVPPPLLFFSAALAIVPIARLIVISTEQAPSTASSRRKARFARRSW
jgi:Ca2+:H+ antiporter